MKLANNDYHRKKIFITLCLLYASTKCDKTHSRLKKRFYKALTDKEKRKRDNRIPRPALRTTRYSSLMHILRCNNDQALITCTGFDNKTFKFIMELFAPVYLQFSPYLDRSKSPHALTIKKIVSKKGRPRMLDASLCLGLVLVYTRSCGSLWQMQLFSGTTRTPLSVWLRFGMVVLLKVLRNHPLACLKLPSQEQLKDYCNMISSRHPELVNDNVALAADGMKIPLEASGNKIIQERFYNGWKHGHFVSNVFVFAPDGTIPIMSINAPGSMHDSKVATYGKVYKKLGKLWVKYGVKTVVDSAFGSNLKDYPYLIKSQPNPTSSITAQEIKKAKAASSCRQMAEWGNNNLQSSFPRLKQRLRYEETGFRKLIIHVIVLLSNLRSRKVGINQIRNVYAPLLELDCDEILKFHNPN